MEIIYISIELIITTDSSNNTSLHDFPFFHCEWAAYLSPVILRGTNRNPPTRALHPDDLKFPLTTAIATKRSSLPATMISSTPLITTAVAATWESVLSWNPRAGPTTHTHTKLRDNVETYVKTCLNYRQDKSEHKSLAGLLEPLLILEHPWESLSMDLIVNLPNSEGGRFSWSFWIGSPSTCPSSWPPRTIRYDFSSIARLSTGSTTNGCE